MSNEREQSTRPQGEEEHVGDDTSSSFPGRALDHAVNAAVASADAVSAGAKTIMGDDEKHHQSRMSPSSKVQSGDKVRGIALLVSVAVALSTVVVGVVSDGLVESQSLVQETTTADENAAENLVDEDAEVIGEGIAGEEIVEDDSLMVDVVGLSSTDAQVSLRRVFPDIDITYEDISGEDRTIWNLGNWDVCSQSVAVGERFDQEEDTIRLIHASGNEGCSSPEQWAQTVEEQWRASWGVDEWSDIGVTERGAAGREETVIKSVSSEKVGSLRVNITTGTIGLSTASAWALSLREEINASLPEDVAAVSSARVFIDDEEADEPVTTSGIDESMARAQCVRELSESSEVGGRIDWFHESNVIVQGDNNTVWQLNVRAVLPNQMTGESSYDLSCVVSGTPSDPEVTEFRIL